MWKSLNPGEMVSLGDVIRHISSHAVSAFGEKAYEIVRNEPQKDRRIIKYIDIGYHLGLEVWLDQFLA